ncbi:hypothetical protein [Porphyromonas pogonae]|uniref:hypothetical protein n=1 Tax=Porphyromonas pogonae TaxID=867595 RepID=UPI002E76696F|nr:hypothetical protein [Porphyromonas pogonae]
MTKRESRKQRSNWPAMQRSPLVIVTLRCLVSGSLSYFYHDVFKDCSEFYGLYFL